MNVMSYIGPVAQLVEHLACYPEVGGSYPSRHCPAHEFSELFISGNRVRSNIGLVCSVIVLAGPLITY